MTKPNKYIAGVLAFFLGGFGIHYFYMGNREKGFIFLGCYILLGITGIVPFVLTAYTMVQGIYFCVMSDEDWQKKFLAK